MNTGSGLAVVAMLSCLGVAGCANGGRDPRLEIAADSACHDERDLDYYYNSDAQPWVAKTFPNARGRTGIPAGARVLETVKTGVQQWPCNGIQKSGGEPFDGKTWDGLIASVKERARSLEADAIMLDTVPTICPEADDVVIRILRYGR